MCKKLTASFCPEVAKSLCLVSLTLDQVITELTIPGVTLDLHKRPYDTRLELSVQDLCVLDRFQNFGPEFELILCSGGKNLLNLSSPSQKQSFDPSSGMTGKSYSYPTFASIRNTVSNSNATTPTVTPIRAHHSDIPNLFPLQEDFGIISPASDSPTLLSVSYHHLTSFSPDHPATRDIDLGKEEEGEEMEAEEWVWPSEEEPDIHKISVHCTGVDLMGELYTHNVGIHVSSTKNRRHCDCPVLVIHLILSPYCIVHIKVSVLFLSDQPTRKR